MTAARWTRWGVAGLAVGGIGIGLWTYPGRHAAAVRGNPRTVVNSGRIGAFGTLPMVFEERGAAGPARFVARGRGYSVLLTDSEAILRLQSGVSAWQGGVDVIRMALAGANPRPRITPEDARAGRVNSFVGKDRSEWHTNLATYGKVRYDEVYPGIDLLYYGNEGRLEYDFVVAPGADPAQIGVRFAEGSGRSVVPTVDASGDLIVPTGRAHVQFHRPEIYQESTSGRQSVEGRFVVHSDDTVGFELGKYDPARPLIIDPILAYSTFYGGSEGDFAAAVTLDAAGHIYVAGQTFSLDFPTRDPLQATLRGETDGFVFKLTPDGSDYVFATYFGGPGFESDFDGRIIDHGSVSDLAVDGLGQVYVVGGATCNFPTTGNAFQEDADCTDNGLILSHPFVAKFSTEGDRLLYSSYFGNGGQSSASAIAVDNAGNAFIVGSGAIGIPTTSTAFSRSCSDCSNQDSDDVFVMKIDTTRDESASLRYSSYLGGDEPDNPGDIAIDADGLVYITGDTESPDFPVTDTAYSATLQGSADVFVAVMNPAASGAASLIYSTYLGGASDDVGAAIATAGGKVFVAGRTESTNFPLVNPLQSTCGCPQTTPRGDAFVFSLDLSIAGAGALSWSTYFGGAGAERATAIALDARGHVYIAGNTDSSDLRVTAFAPQKQLADDPASTGPQGDAFVAKIRGDGGKLLYSTYLGGSGWDLAGALTVTAGGLAYVVGETRSDNFPVVTPVQGFRGGGDDGYLAVIKLVPDFTIGAIADITVPVGGSGSANVSITSIDEFDDLIKFLVGGVPAGLFPSFSPESVTADPNETVTSTMSISAGPSLVAGTYSFTVRADSSGPFRDATATVHVEATSGGIADVIETVEALGCIANDGISNALTSKLDAAQSAIDAGNIQEAVNILTALLHQLRAQAGKQITTSCTDGTTTFNPVEVLIANVEALLATLGGNLRAKPALGTVTQANGLPAEDAIVTIIDARKVTVADADADATGFYYMARTDKLVEGASYTVKVTPASKSSKTTPSSQTFTWRGSTLVFRDFVVK